MTASERCTDLRARLNIGLTNQSNRAFTEKIIKSWRKVHSIKLRFKINVK